MKVLVACEESQAVCKAFRERGHLAFSCDIQECSGGHPEWHIKGDCLPLLNGNCDFYTQDGAKHTNYGKWDMIISHPPCTDICNSGARHFDKKRADGRQRASIEFFAQFLNADCDKIIIENPMGICGGGKYIMQYFPDIAQKYGLPRTPTQKVQPYEYGHPFIKTTCLWEKGVQPLQPTNVLERPAQGWENQSFTKDGRYGGFNGKFNDAKTRSKTFPGIAKAMAEQWG